MVPGAGLEPACADFKDRPGCQRPTSEWSRLPVPTRVSCLTGAGSQPCATAGHRRKRWRSFPLHGPPGSPCLRRCWVSSAGVGPALSAISTLRLLPNLGYEDVKPLPGADPGHPPYEGGATAVCSGEATGTGIEPVWPRFRALMGCQQPSRYRVRGPGVESATTTFERTALPIGCTRAWYAASDSNAHLAD